MPTLTPRTSLTAQAPRAPGYTPRSHGRALVIETRTGTNARWFTAHARGLRELQGLLETPDLVLVGDPVAIDAVLGGHLAARDAEREGQIDIHGAREHVEALQRALMPPADARAA